MKLLVERYKEFDDCTIGRFQLFDNKGVCLQHGFTLEPAGPDTTTPNKDRRIPQGKYKAIWASSSQTGANIKGKLPLVYNEQVSKDRKIRIHIGNYGKDTLGCILLGNETRGGPAIFESKSALKQFIQHAYPDAFEIEITNAGIK